MDPSPTKPAKSRGLPVWTLMVAMLIGAAVLIGLLVTLLLTTRSRLTSLEADNEQMKEEQLQNEIQVTKLKADESRALAQQQRGLLLTHATTATNALEQLLVELRQTEQLASDLKTGDAGRQVAAHADLVPQARRFYEVILPTLPSSSMVVQFIQDVRRIQQTSLNAAESDFTPSNESTVEVQNAAVWAKHGMRQVSDAQTLLRSLVQESKIKVGGAEVTATSPTLEAAIASLKEAELSQFQKTVREKTDEAEAERRKQLAEAEADAIRRKAAADAKATLDLADAEAIRIQEAARITAEQIKRAAEEAAHEDRMKAMAAAAANQAQETKTTVAAQQTVHEAEKVRLRAKASSAEVQGALAPFISPGLWKAGGGVTYDMQPQSLTALRSSGALDESTKGMTQLAQIARTPADKVRPRWKMGPTFFNNPVQSQKVREAQQLLIELGDVMVEMGLLAE